MSAVGAANPYAFFLASAFDTGDLNLYGFPETALSRVPFITDSRAHLSFNDNFGVQPTLGWIYQALFRVKDWRLVYAIDYTFSQTIGDPPDDVTTTYNLTGGFEFVLKSSIYRKPFGSGSPVTDETKVTLPCDFAIQEVQFDATDPVIENMTLSGNYAVIGGSDPFSVSFNPGDSKITIGVKMFGLSESVDYAAVPTAVFDDGSTSPDGYTMGTPFWFLCNIGIFNLQPVFTPSSVDAFYGTPPLQPEVGFSFSQGDAGSPFPTMAVDESTNEVTLSIIYTGAPNATGTASVILKPDKWWTNGGMYNPDTGLPV